MADCYTIEAILTEAERGRWHGVLNEVLAVVATPVAARGQYGLGNGTGALVRLGGRDFIFGVGHVVWDDSADRFLEREEVAVAFPRTHGLVVPIIPGTDIAEMWHRRGHRQEPDAAVFELDAARRGLWQSKVPLTGDDFGRWQDVSADERVLVAGFPNARLETKPSAMPAARVGGDVTLRFDVSGGSEAVVTKIRTDVANPHAPADGRCFHVGWEMVGENDVSELQRIIPDGVSGGPVFAIDSGSRRYIGVVRSKFEDRVLLCEPVTEPLRLLLQHPDAAVVEEARAILARLDRP